MLLPQSGLAETKKFVSMNVCADQLLMQLANHTEILALSPYATDSTLSFFHEEAKAFSSEHATLETILSLQPDLVLVGPGQISSSMRTTLAEHHIHLLEVGIPSSLEEVQLQIKEIAAATGHPDKGKSLIAEMQSHLIQTSLLTKPLDIRPRIAFYHQGGYSEKSDALTHSLMQTLHGELYTTQSRLSLEQLATDPPDILIYPVALNQTKSLGEIPLTHPVFSTWNPKTFMPVDANLLMCNNNLIAVLAQRIAQHILELIPPTPNLASIP